MDLDDSSIDDESASSSDASVVSEDESTPSSESEEEETEEEDEEETGRTSLEAWQRPSNILEVAARLFGKADYEAIQCHNQFTLIAYRNAGFKHISSPDSELIATFLSNLCHHELNQIDDKTGESLLHLAVFYNRAGHTTLEGNQGFGSLKNVVQWLLKNPNFQHVYTQSVRGYNAFHTAVDAHVPAPLSIYFSSVNHGGYFDRSFVAMWALQTLLRDKSYSNRALNEPNRDGFTTLALAMENSTCRIERCDSFRCCCKGASSVPLKDVEDTSIFMCLRDYPNAISKILESSHLRLHRMFGVSHVGTLPFTRRRDSIAFKRAGYRLHSPRLVSIQPTKDLVALRNFCFVDAHFAHYHAEPLETLLSNNVGGLSSEIKAKALVTSIYSPKSLEMTPYTSSSYKRRRQNGYVWAFDPSSCGDKAIGAVLRKFFRAHAAACVQAVDALNEKLVEEANELLLRPHCHRLNMNDDAWGLVLQFADWRRFVSDEWKCLDSMSKEVGCSVAEFFLGGIGSCLGRKHGLPNKCWVEILAFSGWTRALPDLESIPGLPTE